MYSGKITDAHVHPFLESCDNIAKYGHPVTCEDFVQELKRCGISQICGSVIHKFEKEVCFEQIHALNLAALKFRDMYPDFYIPGIHIHGGFPEESCRELERMYYQHGVRWVGELVNYHIPIGEYNSPGIFKIYEVIRDLGMTLNIHCADLALVEDVVKNFPQMKFVLAHPQDCDTAPERFALIARYPNAHIDISGTGLFRWNMLRYAVNCCGSEKIIFGSDFPVCSPGMNLGGVFSEHLTEKELENVLFRNFERLIE